MSYRILPTKEFSNDFKKTVPKKNKNKIEESAKKI